MSSTAKVVSGMAELDNDECLAKIEEPSLTNSGLSELGSPRFQTDRWQGY